MLEFPDKCRNVLVIFKLSYTCAKLFFGGGYSPSGNIYVFKSLLSGKIGLHLSLPHTITSSYQTPPPAATSHHHL